MKKKLVSVLLVAAMGASVLAGCGSRSVKEDGGEKKSESSGNNVLEFYHGYYQDESEWPAAQVMRDIYDEFAQEHADGDVTFKPIAVENSGWFFPGYGRCWWRWSAAGGNLTGSCL